MKSLNSLKSSLLQTKKIGDFPTKRGRKDGSVLFFATNYQCRATHHIDIEAIFFPIG